MSLFSLDTILWSYCDQFSRIPKDCLDYSPFGRANFVTTSLFVAVIAVTKPLTARSAGSAATLSPQSNIPCFTPANLMTHLGDHATIWDRKSERTAIMNELLDAVAFLLSWHPDCLII